MRFTLYENYFYPSPPFFKFALSFLIKVAVNGLRKFDCLAKLQHDVNIVLFSRNFFANFLTTLQHKHCR